MADPTAVVEGLVHEPTQTAGRGLDLTVEDISGVTAPGRVDFGGDELEPAATDPHERQHRHPDDDYAWWDLASGQYLLEFNETLVEGATVRVQTRDAVLARGAFHPTLVVDSLDRIPLAVGGEGLQIKENARVATVIDVLDGE